jgi:hypothetical protein
MRALFSSVAEDSWATRKGCKLIGDFLGGLDDLIKGSVGSSVMLSRALLATSFDIGGVGIPANTGKEYRGESCFHLHLLEGQYQDKKPGFLFLEVPHQGTMFTYSKSRSSCSLNSMARILPRA